jgi:hypothetical protein
MIMCRQEPDDCWQNQVIAKQAWRVARDLL